jgi:hypothetical protein
MKKYLSSLIVLSAVIVIALAFRSNSSKFGPKLTYILDHSSDNDFIVYIYLSDKGPDAQSKLSNPLNLVTQRSIERRLKVKSPDNVVEITDVPMYQDYINILAPKVLNLRNQIKCLNAVSAELTRAQLDNIAELNFVNYIELVEQFKRNKDIEKEQSSQDIPVNKNGNKNNIEADTLSYGTYGTTQITQMNVNLVHDQGIFGQGILIASLDDGFRNQTHPCFTNPINPINIISQYDFQLHLVGANHTLNTHGTTTISCIACYQPGQLVGTAFKSSFLVARTEVDSFERYSEMDNWAAGSQWADSLGADIITSSLGYLAFDPGYGPNYSWTDMNGLNVPVTRAATIAAHNGITVFNSAGNNGPGSHNTLGAPADADSILTMGAVDGSGFVTSFSSVGPTTDIPARIKPDVMAMGEGVQTANGSGSGYSNGGAAGTSYSCPLAAGVGALILSANKSLTPLQVRGILRKFASNTNSPNNTYGWGIINAALSVDSARKLDTSPPVIQHTPPFSFTSNTGAITMRSRITDNGIIRFWSNQAPLVYYRKSTNGGINWTSYSSVLNSYYNNVDSFFFAIPGSPTGTRVEYYFAAQDIALPNPNVATLPAGGSGINPPGSTPPPTRFYYDVVPLGIVSNSGELPKVYKLYNNYPNPFNPTTKFRFDIPNDAKVSLIVYDVLGREVSHIMDGEMKAGSYTVDFNASNLTSGIYFYKLTTPSFVDTKKMILLK